MKNALFLKSTPSTNDFFKELLRKDNFSEGYTVYTDFQTQGKGQQGNVWEAERGKNLLFSTVIYPIHIKIHEQFIISQLISLAIKKTLEKHVEHIRIKWPNDIYWKDKKLGGILIENSLLGNSIKYSVIGVGLNINQIQFSNALPNPVSLKQITGKAVKRSVLLAEINDVFLNLYQNYNFDDLKKEYFESLYHNDKYYEYRSDSGEVFSAKILAINDDGKLILQTKKGKICEFYFKEVQFLI